MIAKAEWTQGEANPRFIVTAFARLETQTAASPGATGRGAAVCGASAPRPLRDRPMRGNRAVAEGSAPEQRKLGRR